MEKHLILFDKYDEFYHRQELWDPDTKEPLYGVSDLWECPEDAIIGRALHDGEDAFKLIKIGLKYSKMGYDKIILDYADCPSSKDLHEYVNKYIDNEYTSSSKNS